MQGLLLWHDYSGDNAAFHATRRAADLICNTYLNQPRRVFDAGSHEMNMAVLHVLVQLHRLTGEARYLAMAREIEKDWERAGDYFRAGLSGTEFFKSPRPRWESLHDLQGLVELWRVTGDARYRDSFLHHWRSIARFDRHNTGGFSSGEQATGNPWHPAPIETCCTVAWMTLGIDALRLTGDPRVADELELSLLNGGLGAQHPSGRWWTYNTPMNGVRESSAHSIVFQARAGTPELNCCSVNGPRVLGSLVDWAVMRDARGLVVNWHGPAEVATTAPDGTKIRLKCESRYPLDSRVRWTVLRDTGASEFALRFRIPGWARSPQAAINSQPLPVPIGPAHLEIKRAWKSGDSIELRFDTDLRAVPGDREALAHVSLYRGPLLLAFDPRYNSFDEPALAAVDLGKLDSARVVAGDAKVSVDSTFAPWICIEVTATNGQKIRLCDFASAGATGLRYRSWLPASPAPPPAPITRAPLDGATIGSGTTAFRWTSVPGPLVRDYRIKVASDPEARRIVAEFGPVSTARFVLDDDLKRSLPRGQALWWKVVARGPHGESASEPPLAMFTYDPSRVSSGEAEELVPGPGGIVVRAPLRGDARPEYGRIERQPAYAPAAGRRGNTNAAVRLNGRDQMLVYALPEEFGEDYSATVWVRLNELPAGRIGQILSLWAGGMDDPLRLTVDGGKLFARIEAQGVFTTRGVDAAPGQWHHVAAVKKGTRLTLHLDGMVADTIEVPPALITSARVCALGGNPNYAGNEFLAADFAEFQLFVRALGPDEVATAAR